MPQSALKGMINKFLKPHGSSRLKRQKAEHEPQKSEVRRQKLCSSPPGTTELKYWEEKVRAEKYSLSLFKTLVRYSESLVNNLNNIENI